MKPTTIILIAVIAAGDWSIAFATGAPVMAQAKAATQTTVLTVDNMTCELCPLTIRAAMERVPGVTSVVIDFDTKTATVTFNPAIATIESIAAASTNVGFPAHVT